MIVHSAALHCCAVNEPLSAHAGVASPVGFGAAL